MGGGGWNSEGEEELQGGETERGEGGRRRWIGAGG